MTRYLYVAAVLAALLMAAPLRRCRDSLLTAFLAPLRARLRSLRRRMAHGNGRHVLEPGRRALVPLRTAAAAPWDIVQAEWPSHLSWPSRQSWRREDTMPGTMPAIRVPRYAPEPVIAGRTA